MRSRSGVSPMVSNPTADNRTMNPRDVRAHSGEIIGSKRGQKYTAQVVFCANVKAMLCVQAGRQET